MTEETKLPFHVDLLKPGAVVHLRFGGTIPADHFPIRPPHSNVIVHKACGTSWQMDGLYYKGQVSPFDLIAVTPAPERKRLSGFVNIYLYGAAHIHESGRLADANSKHHERKRIACLDLSKLRDENGELLYEGHGLN